MAKKYEYFGKYVLMEKLAMGGMAEVFLARAPGAGGIGKFVAIKRILPQFADSPEFIDMFKEEAKIAINLSHSNIVTIHEFGVQKDQFFLVMDYVEGKNLRQILNKMKKSNSQFSIDQIVYMIKEVAGGLDHAHRCLDGSTGKPLNITHRDISPQNLMVSFEGEVKIVDFGIAKAESQIENTRAGTLKGKFGYMSPEQAEGQPVDLRTDIFSLGIVLWELLANDRLFIANNEINTLRKIRDCQVPSLRKINPNIHQELERIAQKALTRDRNLRYQTSAAIYRDLNRFLNRQFPDFSTHDFAVFIKTLFAEDILDNRQRLIEYAQVPFKEISSHDLVDEDEKTLVSAPSFNPGTNSFINPKSSKTQVTESEFQSKSNKTQGESSFPASQISFSETQSGFNKSDILNKTQQETQVTQATQVTQVTHTPATPPEISSKVVEEDDEIIPSISVSRSGKSGVLDERALRNELKREIHVTAQNPYVLSHDSEDRHLNERTMRGPATRFTQTQIPIGSKVKAAALGSISSLAIVFAFLVGSYLALAKIFPQPMRPVIAMTNPILGPIHRILGIKIGEARIPDLKVAQPSEPTQNLPVITETPAPGEISEVSDLETAPTPVQRGDLLITSKPSGAEIYINGTNTGSITPSKISLPRTGAVQLSLRRTGYLEYILDYTEDTAIPNRLNATLQNALIGYIDIDVLPPKDVRIYINGKLLNEGRLPITRYAVPAETKIVIRAENPYTKSVAERSIIVPRDRRQSVVLSLKNRAPSGRK